MIFLYLLRRSHVFFLFIPLMWPSTLTNFHMFNHSRSKLHLVTVYNYYYFFGINIQGNGSVVFISCGILVWLCSKAMPASEWVRKCSLFHNFFAKSLRIGINSLNVKRIHQWSPEVRAFPLSGAFWLLIRFPYQSQVYSDILFLWFGLVFQEFVHFISVFQLYGIQLFTVVL